MKRCALLFRPAFCSRWKMAKGDEVYLREECMCSPNERPVKSAAIHPTEGGGWTRAEIPTLPEEVLHISCVHRRGRGKGRFFSAFLSRGSRYISLYRRVPTYSRAFELIPLRSLSHTFIPTPFWQRALAGIATWKKKKGRSSHYFSQGRAATKKGGARRKATEPFLCVRIGEFTMKFRPLTYVRSWIHLAAYGIRSAYRKGCTTLDRQGSYIEGAPSRASPSPPLVLSSCGRSQQDIVVAQTPPSPLLVFLLPIF